MAKRKITTGYLLFFLLLWPDTWRILIGAAIAGLLGPAIIPSDLGSPGSWMFYIMLATIGYSVAGIPAREISKQLKKLVVRLYHEKM